MAVGFSGRDGSRALLLPQVNSSVPEADPGEHASQVHAGARLQVLGVAHGSGMSPSSAETLASRPVCCRLTPAHRFMYLATTLRAWRDHTSLMGLLPWYAGRLMGLGGQGLLWS